MKRCTHDPIRLFDPPPAGNERAAVLHFLSGYTRKPWVICRHCGETGYWGGHGFKRRIRWGYGGDDVLQSAERHNRAMVSQAHS